jgi:hypothetical protein
MAMKVFSRWIELMPMMAMASFTFNTLCDDQAQVQGELHSPRAEYERGQWRQFVGVVIQCPAWIERRLKPPRLPLPLPQQAPVPSTGLPAH